MCHNEYYDPKGMVILEDFRVIPFGKLSTWFHCCRSSFELRWRKSTRSVRITGQRLPCGTATSELVVSTRTNHDSQFWYDKSIASISISLSSHHMYHFFSVLPNTFYYSLLSSFIFSCRWEIANNCLLILLRGGYKKIVYQACSQSSPVLLYSVLVLVVFAE